MLIKAILVFILYLIEYYLYGIAVARLCRRRHISMVDCIITGFWTQGLVFFVFIMPFKLAVKGVDFTSKIWLGVWIALMAIIIVTCHRVIKDNIKKTWGWICDNRYIFIAIGLVMVAELLYEGFFGNYTNGNGAAYFVGAAASDLFSNHFGTVMPETGYTLNTFDTQYFLQTYVHHTAVVCKLTGLAVAVEMRTVMSGIVILLSGFTIYELSRAIFKNKLKKVLLFWMIYQVVILIFANSVYIPAYYLFYRAFEGKTIFGMLLIPYVLACFWRLYDDERDVYTLVCLVLALLGSFTFCMSTMYVLPFLLLGFLPVAVVQHRPRQLINWCAMMVPSAMSILYYLLVMKGVIDLTIKW